MTIFNATFSAVAVSAAQDVFEIVTPANVRARIREVRLGQYTDFGDAAAEILSVTVIRGFTTSGSGGSVVTPAKPKPWTPASLCTVEANNTTVANTGTTETLIADTFNIAAGWWYRPDQEEMLWLDESSRLVVRITAPADSLTMNGTIVYDEMGMIDE
jgi:hypothetical protein